MVCDIYTIGRQPDKHGVLRMVNEVHKSCIHCIMFSLHNEYPHMLEYDFVSFSVVLEVLKPSVLKFNSPFFIFYYIR